MNKVTESKKVVRKIISSKGVSSRVENLPAPEVPTEVEETKIASNVRSKKVCYFCTNDKIASYTDVVTLRRFLTERGKIVPRARTGACSKHQRKVSKHIKYARHLSLLPFTSKV